MLCHDPAVKIDEEVEPAWNATGGKAVDSIGDAWDSVFG